MFQVEAVPPAVGGKFTEPPPQGETLPSGPTAESSTKAAVPGPCSLSTPRRGPGRVAPSEGLRVEFASGIRPFSVELIQEERS